MLHPICGRALVAWPILAAREAGAGRIAVIVSPDRDISGALPEDVEIVPQPEADGTGGAMRAALPLIEESETVLVLSGDVPLVSAELIAAARATHERGRRGDGGHRSSSTTPAPTAASSAPRDGEVDRIVEAKADGDATPEELAINEINAGIYVFDAAPARRGAPRLTNDNAQGEYYLPDVLPPLREAGRAVVAHVSDDPNVILGVNSRADLARSRPRRAAGSSTRHMLAGVTVVDPGATWIEADVEIAADARIEPGCSLSGATEVGSGSVVGPHTTLIDSELGEERHRPALLPGRVRGRRPLSVGPFAYLRPGAELAEGAKAGTFVEIKNSRIGAGSKVPHLSYIGDADVGEGANLGAATITANYDGFVKTRTKIGRRCENGVDTTLVAPVEVGDSRIHWRRLGDQRGRAAGALAMSAPEQANIEGYAERKAAKSRRSRRPVSDDRGAHHRRRLAARAPAASARSRRTTRSG